MAARKSERLLNLLITLLVARNYVTKDRIRQVIDDYRTAANDEAFDKMFERDKDDLRQLGVPIEVGSADGLFDDEPGYRIDRAAFELPEIELTPEEAAVVGLAARVWQHAGLASATSDALVKLTAGGVRVDRSRLAMMQPQLPVNEPTFEAIWRALSSRTPIGFDYRKAEAIEINRRLVQPWGVVSYRGRWYVVGFDCDREAPRLFRLSRIVGEVTPAGRPGAYEVPPGTDLRQLTSALAPPPQDSDSVATLLIRDGRAPRLRRRGHPITGPLVGSAPAGWSRFEVPLGRWGTLADEVLGHGEDVVVEAPADLREQVLGSLRESAQVVGQAGAR
ncbi:MAG: WYL domain-containing protein [Nocardioidaceae bacterium]